MVRLKARFGTSIHSMGCRSLPTRRSDVGARESQGTGGSISIIMVGEYSGIDSNDLNQEGKFVLDHLTNGARPPLSSTLAIGSNGSLQLADRWLWWNALYAGLLRFASRHRSVLIVAAHVIAFATIYPLAFLVRFDLHVPPMVWRSAMACLPLVVGIKMAAFMAFHCHRCWRRIRHLRRPDHACAGSDSRLRHPPLSEPVFPCGIRDPAFRDPDRLGGDLHSDRWDSCRWLELVREDICQLIATRQPRRSLVVGTGDASVALIRELHDLPRLGFKVIGILDSDRSRRGTYLAGLKVVGSPDQLKRIASRYRIETLLIPTPAVSPREVRSLVTGCKEIGVKVQVVPGIGDLVSGAVTLRPRDVNIHDLLRRDPVHLDGEAVGRFLRGRAF